MNVLILQDAENDLQAAFDRYHALQSGLSERFLHEFSRAVDRILEHPGAWQSLDDIYRRCRLHRFPYGLIYRVDAQANQIIVVALMHLSRQPGAWRTDRPT